MGRKSLLLMFAVFFASDAQPQAMFGFALVMLALALHVKACPFVGTFNNQLELASLACTVTTC